MAADTIEVRGTVIEVAVTADFKKLATIGFARGQKYERFQIETELLKLGEPVLVHVTQLHRAGRELLEEARGDGKK